MKITHRVPYANGVPVYNLVEFEVMTVEIQDKYGNTYYIDDSTFEPNREPIFTKTPMNPLDYDGKEHSDKEYNDWWAENVKTPKWTENVDVTGFDLDAIRNN